MVSGESPQAVIEGVVREEWGRVLSILVAKIGDFELAEDALQDALVAALDQWGQPGGEIPINPSGWLLTVAKRKMIDQVRRRENFRKKEQEIVASIETDTIEDGADGEPISDERLRLIFTCCHPAIGEDARIALALQTLGGLKTPEVARAFLVPEATMAQRLVRAKRKIKIARIPYEIPEEEHLPERMESVLATIYLIFNEGYSATQNERGLRIDLCEEGIRLGRILVTVAPQNSEAKGLLALMLLHHSRAGARTDADGNFVTLESQDRSLWDQDLINQGTLILDEALANKPTGAYQLQAAISALHARASDHDSTDWQQIYTIYGGLHHLHPTPVVRLNAIVALSFAGGPEAALEALGEIRDAPELQAYLPLHATEADLLRRASRKEEAATSYRRAIELANNPPERRFLEQRLAELDIK